ncbi:restriction endonuclease subunit S [Vibrio harveyi]|uniref:restriction endonuclease subunit S n=1 Tax=Vibrio harveyi TaxID=669 RepID=UPI002F4151C2
MIKIIRGFISAWHGAIAISEHTGDCTSVVHVCDSHFNKFYIAYFLKMLAIMNVYKVISNGVRGNTSDFRSWSKFGEIQIILPPMDEQAAIVELLSKQIQDTERAIEVFQNQIVALKEYKASFIHTVVTGKVKVTPEMVEQ